MLKNSFLLKFINSVMNVDSNIKLIKENIWINRKYINHIYKPKDKTIIKNQNLENTSQSI